VFTFDILQILASQNGELNFVQKLFEMGADVAALDQDKVFTFIYSFKNSRNITVYFTKHYCLFYRKDGEP